MVDGQTRAAHAIFVKALERQPEERDAFLAEACASDGALRDAVNRLLDAVDQTTTFLEAPALSGHQRTAEQSSPNPTFEARGYRVIRRLGVGGMATVYEAEQCNPQRLVALKVMQRSLVETSALQRFHFETQVLARLKHPGIAQIYEVGTLEDEPGNPPFFSMELVEGARPITAYASDTRMNLHDRLTMFVDICDAIRCGHQAGVIHRDLKPSNVLVDSAGRVKVIDFGIARSVETRLTLDTERQNLVGTLNYMSPEQSAGGDRVDTRADVYALGVILYELVTGQLPHDLSKSSIAEAMRIIESVRPERPGAVLRDATGDLDVIILTAMDKDPERRYSSASEFAEDVRRFLEHKPIEARPPTLLYQARKFARRHRPFVLAGATVLAVLIAGIVVTSRMAYVIDQERQAAERRGRELERVTEFQRSQLSGIDVAAMGQLLRDQLTVKITQDSISLDEADALFAAVNFTSLALKLLEESVLDRSHVAIDERFADQPLLRATLLQTLAGTMNTLGLADRAEPVLASALAIRQTELGRDHEDTLVSAHSMGSLLGSLGRYAESYEYLQDTYDRRTRILGPDHRGTLTTANALGGVLRFMGQLHEAAVVWESTLDARRRIFGNDHPDTLVSLNNVGVIRALCADLNGAAIAWRELLDRQRRLLGEEHHLYRRVLTNLGVLLLEQGELEAARPLLEHSLEALQAALGEDHPGTLTTMANLGDLMIEQEDPDAGGVLRACHEARIRVLGRDHPATLRSRGQLAYLISREGQAEEGVKTLREVLALQQDALGSTHPDVIFTTHLLAKALLELGQPGEAAVLAKKSIDLDLASGSPAGKGNARFDIVYAESLEALGRFGEAEAALLEAHRTLDEAVGRDQPRAVEVAEKLVDLYSSWHRADPQAGHDVQAEAWSSP
jgi:tetratricopeptide (TPR) repeat protein